MLLKKKVKEPEPQQCKFKIPKKPFYRSVTLDISRKAKIIQVKLWKINSLRNLDCNKDFFPIISRLSNNQRVFKNLRRYDHSFPYFCRKVNLNQLTLKSWRLETLMLFSYVNMSFSMNKSVRRSINPHLKDLYLRVRDSPQSDIKGSFDSWKYLINCNLWFYRSHAFNTKNIRGLANYIKGSNKNQMIPNIQGILQSVPFNTGLPNLSLMKADQLPNLKTLRIDCTVSDPSLDFIKNYSQLTTLFISTADKEVASFEFLNSLPNLKRLNINSCVSQDLEIPKKTPLIHSLEKLQIFCQSTEFSSENLQEFLLSNESLKSLEIYFPLQDDYIIFHDDLILSIERLKLKLLSNGNSMRIAVKKLAGFLAKNPNLKVLEVNLGPKLSLEDSEILQKSVASMASLEQLVWYWPLPPDLQDIKLKDFKRIFYRSPKIQKLDLDFGSGILMPNSCLTFIDTLVSLKSLRFLSLKVVFLQINPETLGKLLQFLRFLILKNTAVVDLDLKGIPQESQSEIQMVLAERNTFSLEMYSWRSNFNRTW